ncbi:erythromycin biosynthesis sensory transduction protein eryC1 [Candidatus Woesearchaeota archaeon]|nr:erythromycin biosynthesis sensory transduction protein eryC1 [Candidatus Woesearchaeota archaeon]|tara:strand:- start:21714 stop:22814 length:1101 start_codon:yes stop_codon:yes gene_type:complete
MNIPFVDLKIQYEAIMGEIDEAVKDIISNTAFVGCPKIDEFEKNFASSNEAKHAIGVNTGTDALFFVLKAMGVKAGDEVITVSNTFIATTETITRANAKVKFVDINKDTYEIDTELLEKAITPQTKVIIPVHLYGQMAEMDVIKEIADKHNLMILEDACQAHNAAFNNKKPGFYGDAAAFSFYPGKNLGAYGDAGAVVTDNDEIAEKIRLLRDHGRISKYEHLVEGFNSRMDGIQAAVLNVKLRHLEEWTEMRRKNARLYSELLKGTDVVAQVEHSKAKHVYHLYVIRVKERDRLMDFLKSKGISTGIHYPIPLHLQPAYKYMNHKEGDFPVTEEYSKEIVSLPMFPELTEEQIKYTVDSIKEFKG